MNILKSLGFAIIAAVLVVSCNKKEKKRQEKIEYYRSQHRDTAIVGLWVTDTVVQPFGELINYLVFNANGDLNSFSLDKATNNRTDYDKAYWYSSDVSKQIYIYTPGSFRVKTSSEESTARYEFLNDKNSVTLDFITGLEKWWMIKI